MGAANAKVSASSLLGRWCRDEECGLSPQGERPSLRTWFRHSERNMAARIRRSFGGSQSMIGRGVAHSLRVRLIVVVLSVAVPAGLALVGLVGRNVIEAQQAQHRALASEAQALSAALDAHLSRGLAVVDGIAASEVVRNRDWPRTEARIDRNRLESGQRVVISEDGRILFDTAGRTGLSAAWLDDAGRHRFVSVPGQARGETLIVIKSSVFEPGLPQVVLVFDVAKLLTLAADNQRTEQAMITIIDRERRILARSRDHETFAGQPTTPIMRRALQDTTEGVVRSRSLDGRKTTVAYFTSPLSGWTTAVVADRRDIEGAIWASAAVTAAVLALVGVLSFWVVGRQARIIALEVSALQADAARMGHGEPIQDREGRIVEFEVIRAAMTAASVEMLQRQDRQRLLINELNHRVKNTLATVQALAAQTLKGHDTVTRDKFQARLVALGGAHDLLTQTTWTEVDIQDAVGRCADQTGRITADGPSLALPPEAALGLCMCLHELETNSLKYGALSTPAGRVAIRWSISDEGEVSFDWTETGGPQVSPPTGRGFGSRLLERVARNELGGAFQFDYRPEGLVVRGLFRPSSTRRWSDPAGPV